MLWSRRKNQILLAVSMAVVSTFVILDIYEDYQEGAQWTHLFVEGTILGISAAVFLILLVQLIKEKNKCLELQKSLGQAKKESSALRNEYKRQISGLSMAIEAQFQDWSLTPAESEVGFLLLKGLSQKEVSSIRTTSEKTVQAQVQAIYKKSGIHSRSEFSAFFLEDLLPGSGNRLSDTVAKTTLH